PPPRARFTAPEHARSLETLQGAREWAQESSVLPGGLFSLCQRLRFNGRGLVSRPHTEIQHRAVVAAGLWLK
ncbi:hypothetical protein BaRGS_00006678, partial [Batillaria attramentaria]